MPVEVAPFAETWGAIMDMYIEAEATGNRKKAQWANDELEELAMAEPDAYMLMVTGKLAVNQMINP